MDYDGTSGECLRHLIARLEARTEEATELRIRLELAEKPQSTLEDDLAEERRSLSHNTMAWLSASPNLSTG
jgi:hypothetical protein